MVVDEVARELYVADGCGNHRVIVFEADTGGYKRHWGAYGRLPDDSYFDTIGEKLPRSLRKPNFLAGISGRPCSQFAKRYLSGN